MYQEIQGDLIQLAKEGKFDVIAHGCNCFCTMGAGIAPKMAEAFGCDDFDMEATEEYNAEYDSCGNLIESTTSTKNVGDINKLGQIDYELKYIWLKHPMGEPVAMNHKSKGQKDVLDLYVVNCYTQYGMGKEDEPPLDYNALALCMKKLNHEFKGKRIGLPQIGCGLAGGDWNIVQKIIQEEMKDCEVTIVIFKNHVFNNSFEEAQDGN